MVVTKVKLHLSYDLAWWLLVYHLPTNKHAFCYINITSNKCKRKSIYKV